MTIVAPEQVPLERVLGPEVGAIYRDVHASHGVELVLGDGHRRRRRLRRAHELHGRTLAADLVVMGVGVAPRVELAEAAGLARRRRRR